MADFKRVVRLLGLYAKMDLQWFLQDTLFCALCVAGDLVSNLSAVAGVFLLAVRFDGVGGLSADEMLFMLGFYTVVTGLFNLFALGCNVGNISRRIGRGQLDHMLIQPLPLTVQLMTEGFLPVSGSGVLLGGLFLSALAAARLGIAPTAGWVALFALLSVSGLMILLGASYLVSTSAFYHPAGGEEISTVMLGALTTLGSYPINGLAPVLKGALLTALPSGAIAYLPAMVLLNRAPSDWWAAWPPVLAMALCGAAALLFQKGMRHYAKYGSQRYRAMGHRS